MKKSNENRWSFLLVILAWLLALSILVLVFFKLKLLIGLR